VVPLIEALGHSIGAEISALRAQVQGAWQPESPEAGFLEWAARASGTIVDLPAAPFVPDTIPTQRWSEAPVLAASGFRMESEGLSLMRERWLEGIGRLMPRDAVPADRNSFFFRPVELLGIAIGARAVHAVETEPINWLRALINTNTALLPTNGTWGAMLTALAHREVGDERPVQATHAPATILDAAALLWLHLVDVGLAKSLSTASREELCRRVLLDATRDGVKATGIGEAGILWIALDRAVRAAVDGADLEANRSADLVIMMCRRFPLLVAELHNRHANRPPLELADEYDVQDLLRALLRVHFDDVRPEEWNPSYGGIASRSDLLIKSERLVIETKMTRKNLGQKEVVEELTVDKAQYRTHPDCGTLVCFVYDPQKRLSNPSALEADLSTADPDLTTHVVVSPRGL